jgi:uncharacterized protein YoxC
MYKTDEALSKGMIDSIGDINDAVNKAVELATSHPSKKTQSKSAHMKVNIKAVSSFFKGKKATTKAAEGEPAAAEPQGVAWAAELVFNTDGSEDGAICNHPDSDGNIRNFETKIDGNTGNEPPTDPAVTEDDNWSVVADAAPAAAEPTSGEASIKTLSAQVATLGDKVKKLEAAEKQNATVITSLKRQLADEKKKNATEGPKATPVAGKSDKGHEYGNKPAVHSWEKKAAAKVGSKIDE